MEAGKAEHLFYGDRHGGDFFQRQETLFVLGLSVDLGTVKAKVWLISSVHCASCYVCMQLMGS